MHAIVLRAALLGATALGLCGCVTTQMKEGLDFLVGQPIQAAQARIGFPDGERSIAGQHIYVWATNHVVYLPGSTTTTVAGNVGTTPVFGSATTTTLQPMNANCTIQLSADDRGIITAWQWSGNMIGCSQYARALRR